VTGQVRPRFELKYLAPREAATALARDLEDALRPDAHGAEGAYRVTSRYYDSAELRAYVEKLDGVDPRAKLRLRTYRAAAGADPAASGGPAKVFVEVKHRRDQRIHKDRVALPAERLAPHLEAPVFAPPLRDLCAPDDLEAAGVIEALAGREPLYPACVVSYWRRAYLGRADPALRLTIDTDLRALPPSGDPARAAEDGEPFLPGHLCVVEVKFHWAMPVWLLDAVRAGGLQVRRYSKYCAGLERVLPAAAMRQLRLWEPV